MARCFSNDMPMMYRRCVMNGSGVCYVLCFGDVVGVFQYYFEMFFTCCRNDLRTLLEIWGSPCVVDVLNMLWTTQTNIKHVFAIVHWFIAARVKVPPVQPIPFAPKGHTQTYWTWRGVMLWSQGSKICAQHLKNRHDGKSFISHENMFPRVYV